MTNKDTLQAAREFVIEATKSKRYYSANSDEEVLQKLMADFADQCNAAQSVELTRTREALRNLIFVARQVAFAFHRTSPEIVTKLQTEINKSTEALGKEALAEADQTAEVGRDGGIELEGKD